MRGCTQLSIGKYAGYYNFDFGDPALITQAYHDVAIFVQRDNALFELMDDDSGESHEIIFGIASATVTGCGAGSP